MAQSIEIPAELARFERPAGAQARLQALLHQQDDGTPLTPAERQAAGHRALLGARTSLVCVRAPSYRCRVRG